MRVIIAGSRTITDYSVVALAIKTSGFPVTEVVCGMARGVDNLGLEWALNTDTPVKRMPADWRKHGLSAGFKRNTEMAAYAEALIAVWDGHSRGTKQMIEAAKARRLKIYVTDGRGMERKSTSG